MTSTRKSTRKPSARRKGTGSARPGRLTDDADAAQRSNPLGLEVDDEVLEFIAALEQFKKEHGRPFPSWSEVLHVVRSLGYRRTGGD